MELFEAIEKRRSYRGAFTNQPVPREDLCRIVAAGMAAPSARNAQTTSFIIVDDDAILARFRAALPDHEAVQTAKAAIVCVADTVPPPVVRGLSFQVEDLCAALENMLLATTALGYASVWVQGWFTSAENADTVSAPLGLPEGKIAKAMLPIGIPAEPIPQSPEKKPFAERAWFNRHGSGA